MFIFLWAFAVLYANMNPITAALVYGFVFAFISWSDGRSPVLVTLVLVLTFLPLLLKMEGLPDKIEERKAHIAKTQQLISLEETCLDFQ